MSEDGEKSAPEVETIKGNEKDRNLNIGSVESKDAEILAEELQSQRRRIEEQNQTISRLEDKIDSLVEGLENVEVHEVRDKTPPLDKYPESIQDRFWKILNNSKRDGISWKEVSGVFDVKKTRAYTVMGEIEDYYEEVGRIEASGNQPDKLVSKKWYLLDLIKADYPDAPSSYFEQHNEPIGNAEWDELWKLYRYLALEKSKTDDKEQKVKRLEDVMED